ncbi:unnamed protein product, partial [Allacma fusca]
ESTPKLLNGKKQKLCWTSQLEPTYSIESDSANTF